MLKKRKFVEKRTYKDRRQYFIDAVAKRRKKIRLKAITVAGENVRNVDIINILKF